MNPINFFENRRSQALQAIKAHLKGLHGVKESFSEAPFLEYQINLDAAGRNWEVCVVFGTDFPDTPPIVWVPQAWGDFLIKPHIFGQGGLCLFDESAWIDGDQPIQVLDEVLRSTRALLEGVSTEDFKDEFRVYWPMPNSESVFSVDSPETLSNPFYVAIEESKIFISSSEDLVKSWYENLNGKKFSGYVTRNGIKIELYSVLLPDQYPKTAADVIELARASKNPNCADQVWHQIINNPGVHFVLLSHQTDKGYVLGGTWFRGPNLANYKELCRGFRKKSLEIAAKLKGKPYLRKVPTLRNNIERLDHDWVHARGADMGNYKSSNVMVIGCGSLGGYVAHFLSRAGIGKLTLLDNDIMKPENLGRHILGADALSRPKAEALSVTLQRQMPHLQIQGIASDWRVALSENHQLFEGLDLIVVAVADLRCELPLNELARATSMPPIIYGWLEAFAIAGHCLFSAPGSGCRACGIDSTGQWSHPVGHFETKTMTKEPGGCAYYQEYGPTALLPVAAMISNTTLKALTQPPPLSMLSTWISDEAHLARAHAKLTDPWRQKNEGDIYARIHTTEWHRRPGCGKCN